MKNLRLLLVRHLREAFEAGTVVDHVLANVLETLGEMEGVEV